MKVSNKPVTAAISQRPAIVHASFEETHHRTMDGVSSSSTDSWRARANAKAVTVIRTQSF